MDNARNIFFRFVIVFAVFFVAGIVAILRIMSLQVSEDRKETQDFFKKEILYPTRGSVLTYDGKPLSVSMPAYELRWDPHNVTQKVFDSCKRQLAAGLAEVFSTRTEEQYLKILEKAYKGDNRYFLLGTRLIDYSEKEYLRTLPIFDMNPNVGGFIAKPVSARQKPYGSLAARTIGYVNVNGEGTGIELKYDHKLRGEEGYQTIYRIRGDEWIPVPGGDYKPKKDGLDVRSTIDIHVQEATETALRQQLAMNDVFQGGTAIVMDVATGAVRGIANMKKLSDGTFDESDNFAIGYPTEPGSTLKLAALMALIEDGYVTLDTPVDAGDGRWYYAGHWISDTHRGGYGMLTAQEAFEKSSNIAFAKMITEAYENNPEAYISRLHNMKLVEKLNLDISGEKPAYIVSTDDPTWSKSTLASLGYGYALTLTPMHTLMFYNAVANGGKMMRPYFIEDTEQDGILDERFGPSVISSSICSRNTIRQVQKALIGVVENGTAKGICSDTRYQIAGKTGTARVAIDGRYSDSDGYKIHQASFAGYFPADNPRYSCIVVLYTGKTKRDFYGATWAAPVFKRIADKIYSESPEWEEPIRVSAVTIPPDSPRIATGLKDVTIEDGRVPDVRGMGLKDALYLLENQGYRVRFKGAGRVSTQNPKPGSYASNGTLITLTMK